MSRARVTRPDADAADAPLRDVVDRPVQRWNLALVSFMRALALLWIAKGLLSWTTILGVTAGLTPFEVGTTGYKAITIYFAIIDLVAGVGLWLASGWGGVMWLLAVMSHLIFAVFFPRFLSSGAGTMALLILATMVYLTLSWLAAVEEG